MDYQKIYNDLISKARSLNRKRGDGNYYEAHHITPKCMGGKGKTHQWKTHPNIVLLTAEEHLFAHKILYHLHPSNPKLLKALWSMMVLIKEGRTYILSNKEYEEIRTKVSELQSQTMSGENHPYYGTLRPQHGLKISGENNPRWSGGVEAQYHSCKCGKRIHKTKTTCLICRDLKGEKNGMFRKTNYDIWSEKYGEEIAKQKWEEQQSKAAISRIGLLAGEKNPNYGKVGELNPFYNKKHTQEVIDNNRRLAKLRTGFDGQNTKIVVNPLTGIFYTATELGELFGVSRGYITRLIRNQETVSKLKELFIVVPKSI